MPSALFRPVRTDAVLRILAACFALWVSCATAATQTQTRVTSASTAETACPDTASSCTHETKVCVPRTSDEVWLVSSRCLGCPDCEADAPQLEVWRFEFKTQSWESSSQAVFLASRDVALPTVFWVHGNRKYADEAREDGMEVYRQLTDGVSGDRPIRFVIYSWPATPIHGLREDAREKAARTNADGYYLASLVNQMDPKLSVDLIGYSFGARIVTGTLHLLGGGELCGWMITKPVKRLAPINTVLVAPAVNNDWLAIGHTHGEALSAVTRMLSLNNFCDRALKHYGVIDPCSHPEALGYTGAVGPLGDNANKLRELNMCCAVGKQHYWGGYFYNPSIVAMIRPYIGLGD
jgi:hypothetical protein